MEPVQQRNILLRCLVGCFRSEEQLHLRIFGSGSPFLAEKLIDETGCLFGCRVVRVDERALFRSVILLEIMPEKEADIFEVGFIVVIMVADGIERDIVARQFLIPCDECPPDIQAGDNILEVSSHTHTNLYRIFLFKGVYQVGMFQYFVYLVGDTCIIKVDRAGLFIGMQLQPVFRKNLSVLHKLFICLE